MSGVGARGRCVSVVLVVALFSAACASYRPVKLIDAGDQADSVPLASLKAGDRVKVITRDGRESEFTLTAISSDALIGENQRIELADVKELETREMTGDKPARWVTVVVVVVVVLALAVGLALLFSSGSSGSSLHLCFTCGH